MTQVEHYERFLALHQQPDAFVMPNPWDGLSALIFKKAGFAALATSSGAFAATLGRRDGRHAVSAAEHLAHAKLLIEVGGLPVNGDFEDGYGQTPGDVAATVQAAIEAGLAGIGIEDTSADPANPIRDFDEAVARVAAAAKVAKGRIVLTGRTDNFIYGRNDLDDTIRRLTAFAEAGADVLYAPYLPDLAAVAGDRESCCAQTGESSRGHQIRGADRGRTVCSGSQAHQRRLFCLHPRRGLPAGRSDGAGPGRHCGGDLGNAFL